MEHTDCQAVVVASASIYWYCLFDFFILIFLYCKIVLFTVCRFSVYLMAFDYQELKGLLTYINSPPRGVTRRRCGLMPDYFGHLLNLLQVRTIL